MLKVRVDTLSSEQLTKKEKLELYKKIVPIAEVERSKILSDDMPIKDTFGLLEQLGFFILKFPSKDEDLSGFHIEKIGINCIYINTRNTYGRQNFSGWHEYYHAVVEKGEGLSYVSEQQNDPIEYKAECFAGCMLMPEKLVKEHLNKLNVTDVKYISYDNLIKMQKYFNVSYSSIVTRLIQIYPNRNKELSQRYALSKPARSEELRKKLLKLMVI